MLYLKIAVLLVASSFVTACSDSENDEIRDKTNTVQDSPTEYPKAVGAWIEARTFMMEREDVGTGCDQVDFRVMAVSGIFSVNRCDQTKSGQLTPDEFLQLDKVTTEAYEKTEGTMCPEIFRFNKYYSTINATNDEMDRNFDPDNNCFRGDAVVVQAYKNYLRRLLDKYRGNSSE